MLITIVGAEKELADMLHYKAHAIQLNYASFLFVFLFCSSKKCLH